MSLFSIFKSAQMGDEEAILFLYNKFLPRIKKCSNSIEYFWKDDGFPLGTTYDDTRDNTPTTIGVMENGFISDKVSATTDKYKYRL